MTTEYQGNAIIHPQMNREMGFYLLVPGLSIYAVLILVIYCFPVLAAYRHLLTTDDAIMYSFLVVFFYPLSMILTRIGDNHLKLFNWKWLFPLSLIPIVGALGLMAGL